MRQSRFTTEQTDGILRRRQAGRRCGCCADGKVIAVLDALGDERGLPDSLIVDHGPEFISRELDIRAYRRGVQLVFIRPGNPTENACIESFTAAFVRSV